MLCGRCTLSIDNDNAEMCIIDLLLVVNQEQGIQCSTCTVDLSSLLTTCFSDPNTQIDKSLNVAKAA